MLRALLSVAALFLLAAAPAAGQSRLPAEGFADLAERLAPAVVNIATRQNVEGVEELPGGPGGPVPGGRGSGGGGGRSPRSAPALSFRPTAWW